MNETAQSGSSFTKNNDSVSAFTSIEGFNAAASLAENGSALASADDNDLGASSEYGPGDDEAEAGFNNDSELESTGMPMKPATGMPMKPATGMLTKSAIVVFHLFGKIIEIPIDVLQFINTYLNQKQMHRCEPGAAVSSKESAGACGNGTAGASMMVPTKSNYDAIFKIPITVLRSVQNLFNRVVEKLCKIHGIYNCGAH
ncbi:uncharacterized protein LOC100571620 [Acyrthosiphon pisum]|uniref:Uncharacterized protein n=1 Tax=Acyrthosiphon pisum TaxID=7029 RepID=A0A8R2NV35_ACYPI|nr:uncharacterized protein LOC100571620 [Acyrthosiphon pisum]